MLSYCSVFFEPLFWRPWFTKWPETIIPNLYWWGLQYSEILSFCIIFKKDCKSFNSTDIFKPLFCHPWLSQRIKKGTNISLFDAPTIVWNTLCFEETLPWNNFYIHFLSPYFGVPESQKGLKLKNPVYIDELYNNLKN